MVIYNRKTLSSQDENGKFVISSPNLPKTDIKVKKSLQLFTRLENKIVYCFSFYLLVKVCFFENKIIKIIHFCGIKFAAKIYFLKGLKMCSSISLRVPFK